MSTTTSPSIFKERPSAVYSGRGFSRIVGELSAGPLACCFFFGASAVVSAALAKPVETTEPFLPLGGGFAVPLPKPVLATVPRIPYLPPVPLP